MASGNSLLIYLPYNNEPPIVDYATIDTRNSHPTLDFQATSAVSAVFTGVMPRQYGGTTGVTVYIQYTMSTATSGDIDWDAAFERMDEAGIDIDADSFAAVNSTDGTTVPGTAGVIDVVNITFTDGADMDSIAVGEAFRLKVTRDSPNDSATGDAEILAVEIKDT